MLLVHGRHEIRQNVHGFRTLSGGIRFTNIALVLEKQYIKLSLAREQANIKSKMRARCLCSGILAVCLPFSFFGVGIDRRGFPLVNNLM